MKNVHVLTLLAMVLVLLVTLGWAAEPTVETKEMAIEAEAPLPTPESRASGKEEEDPLAPLIGESLPYDIAFLWFNRLAHARLSFVPGEQPGTFRAELAANTRGLAATLTRDRNDVFSSVMERMPDGRLRSLVYESQTTRGRGSSRATRISRYTFNYEKREVYRDRIRHGEQNREVLDMAEGDFVNDALTAFYNFRAGYFGEIKPGGRYEIPAFSREGPSAIIVQVYTAADRPRLAHVPTGGMLARVEMDEEVFDTGGGAVYVWFDEQGRPGRGIVENVLNMGDVRGHLLQ